MNSRKEWIDGLRALAMLIVMTWHISNGINSQWLFSLITAPIMIPLFFSITGYVFNDCEGNQKLFYTKLFKYLVFPWLCLAFLKGSINALINRSFEYFLEYSSNLFTGSNLWYFPCCIIAEILFFYNPVELHPASIRSAPHLPCDIFPSQTINAFIPCDLPCPAVLYGRYVLLCFRLLLFQPDLQSVHRFYSSGQQTCLIACIPLIGSRNLDGSVYPI